MIRDHLRPDRTEVEVFLAALLFFVVLMLFAGLPWWVLALVTALEIVGRLARAALWVTRGARDSRDAR